MRKFLKVLGSLTIAGSGLVLVAFEGTADASSPSCNGAPSVGSGTGGLNYGGSVSCDASASFINMQVYLYENTSPSYSGASQIANNGTQCYNNSFCSGSWTYSVPCPLISLSPATYYFFEDMRWSPPNSSGAGYAQTGIISYTCPLVFL